MQTTAASPTFTVAASRADVEAILRSALAPEQLQYVSIADPPPPSNPLLRRRGVDIETVSVVLSFVSGSLSSGLFYDLVKEVTQALARKLGEDRVKQIEPK